VLVDHRGPLGAVAQPNHEVVQAGPAVRGVSRSLTGGSGLAGRERTLAAALHQ
jgi:hypothetical protein